MTQQDTQPPAETLADREGIFADWSTQTLAGQCHMQAREQLDPEFSQFMTACGNRLAALTRRAGGDAIPAGEEEPFTGEHAWDELVNVDDRTSPEEYPDMCLITRDELIDFMNRATPKPPAGGDAGDGFIVKLDNWMTVSVEDGDMILRNEAGEPIAFGKLGPNADFPAGAAHEPFGHWVEQKHADPVLLRKPSYIPEPSDLRTVTPLYTTPKPPACGDAGAVEKEARFLCDRLAEFEREITDDDLFTQFNGHVAPSAARLRAALSEGRSHG